MKIFNTLTRRKEELKTLVPNELKVYACGPTVYNYIHIGNARPLCVFDMDPYALHPDDYAYAYRH